MIQIHIGGEPERMVKMFSIYKRIRNIEKALNIKPKKIDKKNVLDYYEELIEKISQWEEENQQELKY